MNESLVLCIFHCAGVLAPETFTLTPAGSVTVLEGTSVTFTCSTIHETVGLSLRDNDSTPAIVCKEKYICLSFILTPEQNNSIVTCEIGGTLSCTEALNITDVTITNCTNNSVGILGKKTATLLIINGNNYYAVMENLYIKFYVCTGALSSVGNLTSTEVDHCTLRLTWTAPYTLQGVPINYYTINITRHSDGAVLRTDTTNTTEYLYSVSSLGETLEIEVAAVNDAGTGNTTTIIVHGLIIINSCK